MVEIHIMLARGEKDQLTDIPNKADHLEYQLRMRHKRNLVIFKI